MLKRITVAIILVLLAAVWAGAAPKPRKEAPPPIAVEKQAKLPEGGVLLDGERLFSVKERILSLTPADRASLISARLAKLARDPLFSPGAISVVEGETSSDIAAGDLIIMTVTDSDARAEGKGRDELAAEFARIIRVALEKRSHDYSVRSILFGVLYTVLSTAFLIALLISLFRFFPRMVAKIESQKGTLIRTIRIQSMEILNQDRIAAIIITAAKAFRLLLILGLLYIYIPLVFSYFPWTRGFAAKLFEYFLLPIEKTLEAVASYLPNLFFIAVIVFITHFANKFCRFFFMQIERRTITIPGFYPEWADTSFKIVRFLIIAFAVVVAFPYLPGSDSPAFKGISVFLGVLFSLGSTSAVANVVAGIILTYMRGFKLGDRVKIADTMGDVVEKTLLVTRIRTIKNVDITIPNSMVLGSHIINYSSSAKEYGLILHTSVTIGYDAPWRKVHELLISAAAATEHILEKPSPFVLQTALDDFYVRYELNAYTERPSVMARIYSDLHRNIQDAFNEAGVEIMSPHYSQIRDGNRTAIPDDYLPQGYRPGGIRVFRTDEEPRPTGCGTESTGAEQRPEPTD